MKQRLRNAAVLGIAAIALTACEGCSPKPPPPPEDSVTFSFAFVGCNRVGWQEKGDPKLALPESTANVGQLQQTFDDIASLERAPEVLFLLGDIVRNEVDGATLKKQLALWQQLWEQGSLAGSSTKLVPITGNHEVLQSVEYAPDEYYEVPDNSSNVEWLAWLNQHQYPPQPGNGPTPASDPSDLLRGDNSQLTFSFGAQTTDGKNLHFVLIDTDSESTFGPTDTSCYQPPLDTTQSLQVPGWIPLHWIQGDLAAASGSDMVFAFGHKPLVYPKSASASDTSDGRSSIFNCGDKMLAQDLFSSFQGTDNFVGYLTAHRHLWDAFQVEGSVWQIIAGDGGSSLESGSSFGFTLVEIYQSGKVVATPYTRPVPDPYYNPEGVGPATASEPVITLRETT